MTHTDPHVSAQKSHLGRRLQLGAAAFAASVALAVPALVQAAELDVEAESTFDAGATSYTVTSVTLDDAGYVVVHEGTATEFGAVIGSSEYLEAGTHTDLEIDLDRAIEDDEYLWPMAHVESNANTTFDGPTVDVPVVDQTNGNLELTGNLTGILAFPVLQTQATTQADGSLEGTIAASGVSLVTFSGTTVDGLVQAAQDEGVVTVAATVDGEFVVYVVGAPEFVNADFMTAFEGGITAGMPVAVTTR